MLFFYKNCSGVGYKKNVVCIFKVINHFVGGICLFNKECFRNFHINYLLNLGVLVFLITSWSDVMNVCNQLICFVSYLPSVLTVGIIVLTKCLSRLDL